MIHHFCHFCGTKYTQTENYPRQCTFCGKEVWRNTTPVAVVLIPIANGLLAIRRNVEPHIGSLALPGGFINFGESWEKACVRECFEETGISLDEKNISHLKTVSAPDSTILIFGLHPELPKDILTTFVHNSETTELVLVYKAEDLVFSLHQEVARKWFEK